jgi:hypothetical protein
MNQIIHLIFVFVSLICIIHGQFSTTCSNSNLLMTPALRQQILDYYNEVRSTLENGQLLLNTGKNALQAESLPDLTWDCEIEEKIYNWLEETCDLPGADSISNANNMTWIYSRRNNDNADTLISEMLAGQPYLTGVYEYFYPQLGRHNLYLLPETTYLMNHIVALSDKAQHIGCAIQHCSMSEKNIYGMNFPAHINNRIYCQISLSENLEFGDSIYQVSPSANYIPPTQDVICQNMGGMRIEEREAILQKINEARNQISQGTYQVGNGNALQSATPLSPLLWSCEDESALMIEKVDTCSTHVIDAEKEFEKIVPGTVANMNNNDFMTMWTQFFSEVFTANPNFNFLSQSTAYSTHYPAAFALSETAETIACIKKVCSSNSPPLPGSIPAATFYHICRAKPSIQIGTDLYQV